MRILVFSDSHGRTQPMLTALQATQADAVFHLGDLTRDGAQLAGACQTLYQVAGNCDLFAPGYPEEGLVELGGKRIFYLHGHTRGVKSGPERAAAQAAALGADVMLFGHTHRAVCIEQNGVLLVNPGAAMDGHGAILSWEPGAPIRVEDLPL